MHIGKHDDAVKCIEKNDDMNLVVSGSWDSTVKLWDSRSSTAVATLPQQFKVLY